MSTIPPNREKSSVSGSDESIGKKSADVDFKSVNDDLVDAEPQHVKFYDYLFRRKRIEPRSLDAIATRRSVFDDPHLGPHYWPKSDYENIHRFDVKARWTAREEKVSTPVFTLLECMAETVTLLR